MTPFEVFYLCLEPFLPVVYKHVRSRLISIVKLHCAHQVQILDVGGRKSPYTVGIFAEITLTDLPRTTDLQSKLHLGLTSRIIEQLGIRRSNICTVMLDDMVNSQLPDSLFDCVVAVEVLEHVKEDYLFVEQVHRVLKPGGVFLMTTPNGDYIMNTNPDHVRHYRKAELFLLLSKLFQNVEIEYAVAGGRFYELGLKSWAIKRPLQTLLSMIGNFVNSLQSYRRIVRLRSNNTYHLIACGKKTLE